MKARWRAPFFGAFLLASTAFAQAPAPESAPAASRPADASILPALTPVRIELMATTNSAVNRIGEHFPIRLAEPIPLPGGGEIPAGLTGRGDIVHAAKSRFGGKPGELILAARYLDWNGTYLPLRSLRYIPGTGRNNQGLAEAVNLVASPVALFITGGEVNIPAGTMVEAKTSAAVVLPRPAESPKISEDQEGSPNP
ncbi:MAG: hypothetical protein QM605_01675 [Sphingobium sp.]